MRHYCTDFIPLVTRQHKVAIESAWRSRASKPPRSWASRLQQLILAGKSRGDGRGLVSDNGSGRRGPSVGPPDFDEATTTRSANHAQSFAEAMVTRAEAPQRVRLGRASGQCVRRGIGAPSVEASVGKPPLGTMLEAALQMG